ncbi:MAG TPA: hypothetical protein VMU84_10390 [Thermoanaerobaculia bacterium]|nr:hypothetical protein [Thermoanaerobaculia bacterium]
MQPSVDDLLRAYQSAATLHSQSDDRTRTNEAATRMVVLSREIAAAGPSAVTAFAQFVRSDDTHLALWAAHHLIDFMEPDEPSRTNALALIENARDTGWLENWRAEAQDE